MTYTFYWHIHHDVLVEGTTNIQERIDYIKKNKPAHEIETRLRLMKPVKGKLSAEFVTAYKAWVKIDETWNRTYKARDKAWAKIDKAWGKTVDKADKTWKKYKAEIEALHAKECGCKEWNGTRLVFTKAEMMK